MNSLKLLGLIGLGITILLNVVSWIYFKKPSAIFFSDAWWSTWFPSALVWIVFLTIGLSCRVAGK